MVDLFTGIPDELIESTLQTIRENLDKECYGIYKQYREREMEEKDWEAVVEETRVLAEKWKSNKWCVRVLIELMGLLEHDDKERRRIAKEVEKEMEEAMQNDKAA